MCGLSRKIDFGQFQDSSESLLSFIENSKAENNKIINNIIKDINENQSETIKPIIDIVFEENIESKTLFEKLLKFFEDHLQIDFGVASKFIL
jgi:formate dehydrogenase maturation protein FdhE